jgi:hypothetical protein
MNFFGKEQISLKLVEMIESLIVKNSVSSIQLQWKENVTTLDNSGSKRILEIGGGISSVANQVSNDDVGGLGKPQLNKRERKNPALKDSDFLWQT